MGRCIGFRNSGYLVLKKDDITKEALIEWFILHLNDYVYVEKNGIIEGIISGKNFDNAIRAKKNGYVVEHEFQKLEEIETENRMKVYDLFDQNQSLLHLPVIKEGILLGEYYDTFQTKENVERYHIRGMVPELQAFYRELTGYFQEKGIHKVHAMIDEEDEYTRNILCQIQGVEWQFCSKYGEWATPQKGELYLDMKYPAEYRNYLNETGVKTWTIFQIMGRILLKSFATYCRENYIRIKACYAVGENDISYLGEGDAHVMNPDLILNDMLGDKKYLKKFYRKNISYDYATSEEVGPLGSRTIRHNGLYNHLMDCKNAYINVTKGVRRTTNQPEKWHQEIHMYGPCIVQGICVTDAYTIESYLQRRLNRVHRNYWKVFNHGAASHTSDSSFCNDILAAMDTELHSGDLVLLLDAFTDEAIEWMREEGIPIIRDNTLFDGTTNYFMNNTYHCNHLANQKYAVLIYPYVMEEKVEDNRTNHKFFIEKQINLDFRDDAYLHNPELLRYAKEVREKTRVADVENKKIAAICTQANPYTRGHYHLTCKAAAEMDYVYIFVVQDSLNALPFLDRMDIVEKAVRDLDNVFVVSCGSFMSSFRTFPDYFTVAKYESGFDLVNVITDTKIFADIFCKELGINYRYLGDEPTDSYTNQLNEHFLEVLPQYGVTPILNKRADYKGKPISASTVRKLVQEGQYKEAENYVHLHTIEFLKKYYHHYQNRK